MESEKMDVIESGGFDLDEAKRILSDAVEEIINDYGVEYVARSMFCVPDMLELRKAA